MFHSHGIEMYLASEQISPDQNVTPFPLLVLFPLTAVLTNVAFMFEEGAIEECEKSSIMATD